MLYLHHNFFGRRIKRKLSTLYWLSNNCSNPATATQKYRQFPFHFFHIQMFTPLFLLSYPLPQLYQYFNILCPHSSVPGRRHIQNQDIILGRCPFVKFHQFIHTLIGGIIRMIKTNGGSYTPSLQKACNISFPCA